MRTFIVLVAAVVLGCASSRPFRAELGAQHPTKTLSVRATPQAHEVVEITAAVAEDEWGEISIVILYPFESIKNAIELEVEDGVGRPIDGMIDVTCGATAVSMDDGERPH